MVKLLKIFINQEKWIMKNDLTEDLKDAKEIKKQKEEQKRTKEEMATWELGKGIKKKEGNKNGLRS